MTVTWLGRAATTFHTVELHECIYVFFFTRTTTAMHKSATARFYAASDMCRLYNFTWFYKLPVSYVISLSIISLSIITIYCSVNLTRCPPSARGSFDISSLSLLCRKCQHSSSTWLRLAGVAHVIDAASAGYTKSVVSSNFWPLTL